MAGSGATAMVGGPTAQFVDQSDKIATRLPWFIGAVVSLSFILLMIVFRSILVPLKAALLNLLSIGAAYGVFVAVFQWGWGRCRRARGHRQGHHRSGSHHDQRLSRLRHQGDPVVKMMGVGLATAVAVDATIVRMVLVPSTMALVGDENWWLPRWLDRLLPHLDIESEAKPAAGAVPETTTLEP